MSRRKSPGERLVAAAAAVPEHSFAITIEFDTRGPFSELFASGQDRLTSVLLPLLRCIYFPLPGDENAPITCTAGDEANPDDIPNGIKPSRHVRIVFAFRRRGIVNLSAGREQHLKSALASAVVLATGCDVLTVGVSIQTDAPPIEAFYERVTI